MEMKRVKQIVSSSADITVHYHGVSVWIDNYDEENNTATIHMRDNDEEKREVPVEELEEV